MQSTKSWYKSSIVLLGGVIMLLGVLFGIDQTTQSEITKSITNILDSVIIIVNTIGGLVIIYRRITAENKPIGKK